jgi:hypothetical protein
MPSSNCKLQTCPPVREGALRQQTRNWLKIVNKKKKKLVTGPNKELDRLTDRPLVVTLFDSDFDYERVLREQLEE